MLTRVLSTIHEKISLENILSPRNGESVYANKEVDEIYLDRKRRMQEKMSEP